MMASSGYVAVGGDGQVHLSILPGVGGQEPPPARSNPDVTVHGYSLRGMRPAPPSPALADRAFHWTLLSHRIAWCERILDLVGHAPI